MMLICVKMFERNIIKIVQNILVLMPLNLRPISKYLFKVNKERVYS